MKNRVELLGKMDGDGYQFSHEIYGEKFYTQKISVIRESGNVDELVLMVSDRVIVTEIDISGEYVSLAGEIRTHNSDGHVMTYVYVNDLDILDLDTNEDYIGENYVEIEGFICKKAEPRQTPKGRIIENLVVAINHQSGKSSYLPCICWGKLAHYSSTLDIGCKVKIAGRIQSRVYKETNVAYELSVQTLEVIE